MKKYILLTLMLFVMTSMWASGIYRFPMTIQQADGTSLTVVPHGNADCHWITTTDGVIIVRNGKGFYVADIDSEGKVMPTKVLAHNKGERTSMEENAIKRQDKTPFLQLAEENLRQAVRRASIQNQGRYYTPHTGHVKGIVILVEFSDTLFTLPNPKKSFEYYMNGEHAEDSTLVNGEEALAGSVKKYFEDISFGKFSPSFDVYGPVKLNKKTSDYGYKGRGGNLVRDVCTAADDIINFADPQYDSDGDGRVDFVCVVYAGYSSSYVVNPQCWIWPSSNGTNIGTFDGAKVYRWLVCNELNGYPGAFDSAPFCRINGIGLFCHEFSHCMGLPDIYPNDTSAQVDNQEMEFWDLMDGGEYLANGNFPPPYTAWERETMGWMTIDTLTTDQKGIELQTVDKSGKAYRFMNPNDSTKREYMLIENIQNKGWNTRQKGHGLLVYHVNYASDLVNVNDYPNNVKGKPRMAVVPADGLLLSSYKVGDTAYVNPATGQTYTQVDYFDELSGDPFPGTKGVTSLKYDMKLPNYKWYIGDSEVKQALLNITEDTEKGIVTFDYVTDIVAGIDHATANATGGKDGDNRIFTIDGRMVDGTSTLPKGVYIQGGRKFVVR